MKESELRGLTFEKYNKLDRKKHAVYLTKFLYDNDELNVISVNSKWGTGKSWFVRMWINYIKKSDEYKDKIVPIYYNAWENDDFKNAFVPLLAEIDNQLFDKYTHSELNNMKEAAIDIVKQASVNVVKTLTLGVLDLDASKEALAERNLSEKYVEEYNEIKNTKIEFIESFELFTKETGKKIYIYVDELDRCRPSFAVETLERIKHYFDVDGIYFILMLDIEQLSHSVKVLYGNDCDTTGYLRRFIDVEYGLPEPNRSEYLLDKKGIARGFQNCLSYLIPFFDLSLRDCDKLIIWVKAVEATLNVYVTGRGEIIMYYYAYFLIIKLKYPEIFSNLGDFEVMKDFKYEDFPNAELIDEFIYKKVRINIIKYTLKSIQNELGGNVSADIRPDEEAEINFFTAETEELFINGWKDLNFLDRFNR